MNASWANGASASRCPWYSTWLKWPTAVLILTVVVWCREGGRREESLCGRDREGS